MSSKDGMNYAPEGKPAPVVKKGEFVFAAAFLDHGHIYGMCNGLIEAGGLLQYVYDRDPARAAALAKRFPGVTIVDSFECLLENPTIHLIAAAAIPNERGPIGCRVMRAGKDYFTDKSPFTTLAQLEEARRTVAETGCKYMVYYSERLHVESAIYAGELIQRGAIGKVVEVVGFGPHRVGDPTKRPDWFFQKEKYGGILCDIASHQFEQFLFFSGAKDAEILSATVSNRHYSQFPELEDFGEAHLLGDNGVTQFVRVDWLTPAASRVWGDGRMFILGTEGYIELRKYVNIGNPQEDPTRDHVFLVNGETEQYINVHGKVGHPYFGQLILDILNRTENAMTQAHAFKAAELSLLAQEKARVI